MQRVVLFGIAPALFGILMMLTPAQAKPKNTASGNTIKYSASGSHINKTTTKARDASTGQASGKRHHGTIK